MSPDTTQSTDPTVTRIATLGRSELYFPNTFLQTVYDQAVAWSLGQENGFEIGGEVTDLSVATVIINRYRDMLAGYRLTTIPSEAGSAHDILGLNFAFLPTNALPDFDRKLAPHYVRKLFGESSSPTPQPGMGSLYYVPVDHRIDVVCLADRPQAGGQDMNTWPIQDVLTSRGVSTSLDMIKQTSRQALSRGSRM